MIYINYGLGFLWKNDQNFIEFLFLVKKGFFLYKWTYFLFSLLKKLKETEWKIILCYPTSYFRIIPKKKFIFPKALFLAKFIIIQWSYLVHVHSCLVAICIFINPKTGLKLRHGKVAITSIVNDLITNYF